MDTLHDGMCIMVFFFGDSVYHMLVMCFFYVEIDVKGAGGGDGLPWMCGVVTSRALMLRLFIWLKHCFGVLVILDCCFVMIVEVTRAM